MTRCTLILAILLTSAMTAAHADVGLGTKPIDGAEVIFDGSRKMLDEKWTYWEGPRYSSTLPIKWKIVDDPIDDGTVVMSDDPAAKGAQAYVAFGAEMVERMKSL